MEQNEGQQDPESDVVTPFAELKEAYFPAAVVALPHITRLIEVFSMAPAEALTEATKAGQVDWVQNLLGRFGFDISEALVEAASKGDSAIAGLLMDTLVGAEDVQQDVVWAIERSGEAAAQNGHLRAAELFSHEIRYYCRSLMPTLDMLNAAAAYGHLDVVKFVIEQAEQGGFVDEYCRFPTSDTLSRAITGGHPDVVEFLLTHENLRWNLKEAFLAAMNQREHAVAERIYTMYPQQHPGKDLFIELALYGCKEAADYLYSNVCHKDPSAVNKALESATAGNQTCVVEFLLDIIA
ncbi:hypothetical protein PHYSODRAFT_332366 [Phytophthora sojae]|uniref:Uncharacterized protein n=1 Tax=Phytophthora sojae (strain P6497) TaxID=1094619 RepID=G4ZGZ2_PHYSP|nr:hypothetical protein PHYSODRAFT_332366 [Phytophthora sojae]EGZ18617.1 hypothetical protein PHYSODRAFT_332366 [Phytophthora sojae]|eukprot:XP_009527675.1 hypothetical protein PHYSODRAFT_332366 [Phytophthora sojae]